MLIRPLFFWRRSTLFAGILLSFFSISAAQFLPVASTMPRVSASYDSILLKTWQGIKKRNIDAYSVPLVHRPKSEQPGDAVSEGVGYGMILALYCNDQPYFNKIWDAAEQYLWQNKRNGDRGRGSFGRRGRHRLLPDHSRPSGQKRDLAGPCRPQRGDLCPARADHRQFHLVGSR